MFNCSVLTVQSVFLSRWGRKKPLKWAKRQRNVRAIAVRSTAMPYSPGVWFSVVGWAFFAVVKSEPGAVSAGVFLFV
jgi:hypothetical protein